MSLDLHMRQDFEPKDYATPDSPAVGSDRAELSKTADASDVNLPTKNDIKTDFRRSGISAFEALFETAGDRGRSSSILNFF